MVAVSLSQAVISVGCYTTECLIHGQSHGYRYLPVCKILPSFDWNRISTCPEDWENTQNFINLENSWNFWHRKLIYADFNVVKVVVHKNYFLL